MSRIDVASREDEKGHLTPACVVGGCAPRSPIALYGDLADHRRQLGARMRGKVYGGQRWLPQEQRVHARALARP
jgi:hypothetical protein